MRIQGIPASPGIAVGPVYVYEPGAREVARGEVAEQDAPREWERLQRAVQKARGQIEALRTATAHRLGAEEAAIFEAHLLILEDDELLSAIRARILEQHANAEAATWDAVQVYREQLLALDDEYLRARAADLEDIGARVIACLRGEGERSLAALRAPSIVVARDLFPSDTATLDPDLALGLLTEEGGPTAHTAILARQLGIPAVVAARGVMQALRTASTGVGGLLVALDGASGVVEVAPDEATEQHFRTMQHALALQRTALDQLVALPSVTPDGHHIELAANVGGPKDLPRAVARGGRGVGLFRTEFLFLDRNQAPTEDEQVNAYVEASNAFPEGQVIIRTLDIGGDKTIPYLPQAPEANPFLGLRGLRLCLAPHFRPLFTMQLRAILRAAAQGARLRVMFPMVNFASELREARALVREVAAELEQAGVPALRTLEQLSIGAMIETPAAAFTTDVLAADADFFSIGTNDLTQYMLAVDRQNATVAPMYDWFHLSVLRAIYAAVGGAHARGRWIGMCGEMAGDPRAIPLLLGIGLDELSMNAEALLQAKRIIRACPIARARALVPQLFTLTTPAEVVHVLDATLEELLGTSTPPAS